MGTAIAVELWCDDARVGDEAIAAVLDEMHRIDRAMSPHRADSELTRINENAGDGAVQVSAEMASLLARANEFSAISDGAFDVTYAAVGQLYDYRAGTAPSAARLEAMRAAVGWRHLRVDVEARTVRFGRPGMRIDLGGFAKGHAVDNAARILRGRGIEHAMVSAGGDSRLIGDRRGRPWMVGVRDPRKAEGTTIATLPLEDCSISTSGDYERWFERGGVRHHHLIDPRSGRSPTSLTSVTVLAANGLVSEALSKIVFVLGVERGLAIVEAHEGADAVVVDAAGRLHFSSGLQAVAPQPRH